MALAAYITHRRLSAFGTFETTIKWSFSCQNIGKPIPYCFKNWVITLQYKGFPFASTLSSFLKVYKENIYLSDEKNTIAIVFYPFFHFTYDHPFRLEGR